MAIGKDSIRIMVTIPKDLNEKLKEKAKKEDRSVSNYVLNLINKDMENK